MQQKILILTDFYKPHISGIVTYINQITAILENKYKITVLTTKYSSELQSLESSGNVEIIRCKPLFKISRGYFSLSLILKFIKIYKNYKYINIHLPLVEILPLLLFFSKKNTIIHYHCLPEFPLPLKIFKFYFFLFGFIASLFSKYTIVLSKDYFINIKFNNYLANKIIEIPPYVEEKNIVLSENSSDKTRIGFLGRICEEKGLNYLISLSNILNNKKINHELIIAGDIGDKRFIKYIHKLKKLSSSNKSIKFIGKLDNNQKEYFYKNIDLFILPSINSFEAFGIVQLEAMSYGVPVISSNINGVRTIINKTKNGYIFETKNLDDLLNKFLLFKKNKFSKKRVVDNLFKYYNKTIFKNSIRKLF